MTEKFRIQKLSPEQGNRTGHPWIVFFPLGHKYDSNGWPTTTCYGVSFDEFERARAYVAQRLNGLR